MDRTKPRFSSNKGYLGQLSAYLPRRDNAFAAEQCGAICHRISRSGAVEILLVSSRETGRWIIPKGWMKLDRAPYEQAAAEAWQEAGVIGLVERRPFGYFSYLKQWADGTRSPTIVSVFLLLMERLVNGFREESERRREWVSTTEAARRVQEPELRTLILKAGQAIAAGRAG
ncbi:NUDIX hydrolase [Rhizobium metallidurans]|uniref:8-oxo-dGTP pyrophosphatase MutT (NUDIX family) n=1 Tax=Rhizobium metallidurans TaxID=1265931 RepID=A0A7W6G9M3_9HYPH|nr:NUDIX domain-containing protein [Rhizobium metallidurans]MBB3963040.1 8-oxo-dGTP pyrophosphatase MutT (NUDIX family) [Rhizobium metallidurans]